MVENNFRTHVAFDFETMTVPGIIVIFYNGERYDVEETEKWLDEVLHEGQVNYELWNTSRKIKTGKSEEPITIAEYYEEEKETNRKIKERFANLPKVTRMSSGQVNQFWEELKNGKKQ